MAFSDERGRARNNWQMTWSLDWLQEFTPALESERLGLLVSEQACD